MDLVNMYFDQYVTVEDFAEFQKNLESGLGSLCEDRYEEGLSSTALFPVETSPPSMNVFIPKGSYWGKEYYTCEITGDLHAFTTTVDGISEVGRLRKGQGISGAHIQPDTTIVSVDYVAKTMVISQLPTDNANGELLTIELNNVVRIPWDEDLTIDASQDWEANPTVPSAGKQRNIAGYVRMKRIEADPKWDGDSPPVLINYRSIEDYEVRIYMGAEGNPGSAPPVDDPGKEWNKLFNVLLDESVTTIVNPINKYAPGINEINILSTNIMMAENIREAITPFLSLKEKLESLDQVPLYDIIIESQSEFERYFGTGLETGTGTTAGGWYYVESGGNVKVYMPKHKSVWLKPNPADGVTYHYYFTQTGKRAYELKTRVRVNTCSAIISENVDKTYMVYGNDWACFVADEGSYMAATGQGDGTIRGTQFPYSTGHLGMPEGFYESVGDWVSQPGQNIFFQIRDFWWAGGFYHLAIDTTTTDGAWWWRYWPNVIFEGFTIDGRGGIDYFGGTRNGPAFIVPYLIHSKLNCRLFNFSYDAGPIIDGIDAGNLNEGLSYTEISNLYKCYVDGSDYGVIQQVNRCKIHDIESCGGIGAGAIRGLVKHANWTSIYNIKRCVTGTDGYGSVLSEADNCIVDNTEFCTVPGTGWGGAVANVTNSRITNIHNSSAHYGGAVYNAENCDIKNLYNCDGYYGGAVNLAYRCNIKNLFDCTSNEGEGGGIYEPEECNISGLYNCRAYSNQAVTTLTVRGGGIAYPINCKIDGLYGCSATSAGAGNSHGGGIYGGNNNKISNIIGCRAYCSGLVGTALGGGVYTSINSTFDNIVGCYCRGGNGVTSTARGGGIYQCNDSKISEVWDCYCANGATLEGDLVYECNNSTFHGSFQSTGSGNSYIDNCTNCVWGFIIDGARNRGDGNLNK